MEGEGRGGGGGGGGREGEEEEDEENEEGGSRLRSTLARAVSAGLMAVTSRSWPDEILRPDREEEREKGEKRGGKQRWREREQSRSEGEGERTMGRDGTRRCPEEEEVDDEAEEVEGTRCESGALTLGFDARP